MSVACSNFKGCCTYPIGGYVSSVLLISTLCAMGATIYGVSSCTFVSITFQSDVGDFENYFLSTDVGSTNNNNRAAYKVGAGLFQWLRPNSNFNYTQLYTSPDVSDTLNDTISMPADAMKNWNDGSCVGYSQMILTAIAQSNNSSFFNMARAFGIASVLVSVLMTIWSFLSACMDWNQIQIFLLSGLNFSGALFTGLTYLFHRSSLCTSLFIEPSCQIENGGLVMIGATILWLVTFLVSVIFVRSSSGAVGSSTQNSSSNHKNRGYESDTVEKQNAKWKADMERSIARKKTLSLQGPPPKTPDELFQKNSYSFDSQKNWHHPIASRRDRTQSYDGSKTSRSMLTHQQHQQREAGPAYTKIQQSYSYDEATKQMKLTTRSTPISDIESADVPTRSSSLPLPQGDGSITTLRSTPLASHDLQKSKNKKKLVVVDDISEPDVMEVYVKNRLDHIQALTNQRKTEV